MANLQSLRLQVGYIPLDLDNAPCLTKGRITLRSGHVAKDLVARLVVLFSASQDFFSPVSLYVQDCTLAFAILKLIITHPNI